jgi:hypothetical protein
MLQWISNSAIDRQKWDACINKCEWGKVYALSWYLDFLTENSWEALILGDYENIMPVPFRKKIGIKYAYRPNFCQQLGVFSAASNLPKTILNDFLKELASRFRHLHYPFNHSNIFENGLPVKLQKRTNLILNLGKPYENLYQSYSGNLKKNLKTAENAELFFKDNIPTELVISLYKNAWQSLNKIPEQDYSNFKALIDFAEKQGIAETIGVYKNETLLASCIVLKFKNRLYYPFSSISLEGRKYAATAFLIDRIINRDSNSDYCLDFEGSDIESVKSFYEKFGPEKEYYYQLDKVFPFFNKVAVILKRFIPFNH